MMLMCICGFQYWHMHGNKKEIETEELAEQCLPNFNPGNPITKIALNKELNRNGFTCGVNADNKLYIETIRTILSFCCIIY